MRGEHAQRIDLEAVRGASRRQDEEGVHRRCSTQILIRNERHLVGDLLQRAHELFGRPREKSSTAVGDELAVAGDRHHEQCCEGVGHPGDQHDRQEVEEEHREPDLPGNARAGRRKRDEAPQKLAPQERRRGGDRHDDRVPVGDVGQLMGEDRFELLLVEAIDEAPSDDDDRVPGIPAGRKRVGHVRRHDRQPWDGHVGHCAEPLEHRLKADCLRTAVKLSPREREREELGKVRRARK
jgi:hypothetical protein